MAGRWHAAANEYQRIVNGAPIFASTDRWREVSLALKGTTYLDMRSFDDANLNSVTLWIKGMANANEFGPYTIQRFEMDCGKHQLRSISYLNYDADGNVTSDIEGGKWAGIVPDTVGERIEASVCR